MRVARVTLLLILTVPLLTGADLTGHWLSQPAGPGQVSIWLESKGSSLGGYIVTPQGPIPIGDSSVRGNSFAFAVMREYFGEERRVIYTGTITDAGLKLLIPGLGGGENDRMVVLTRVSTETPKQILPPLPKIRLAPAPDVSYNGLAKTPPMGWNGWTKFRSQITDQVVRQIADAMSSNGMRDAGYIYVNIDDSWQGSRDDQGNIQPNQRFPDMKALADYIHRKGLKFGLYSSPGRKTCAGFEGSFGHEEQDARTWAAWGVDYIKYDWCTASSAYENSAMPAVYAKMGEALAACGRPIVYSICQYGVLGVGDWAARSGGNLWRTTSDIRDNWFYMSEIGFDRQTGMEKYAGPGHWNDPDVLQAAGGGMTETEYRTQMSLWCLLAAPLVASSDLRNIETDMLEILTNKEVIAVDQDALGKQGKRAAKVRALEVWAKPLTGGALAVGLFNRGDTNARSTARWEDLSIQGSWNVRDLWAHAERGRAQQEFVADVPAHGVVMVKLTRN